MLKIYKSPEIALRKHFKAQHGTKTTLVFLPADGEGSWSTHPSSFSLLSGSTAQPENIYSCILKVRGQVRESQKRLTLISININHSYSHEVRLTC